MTEKMSSEEQVLWDYIEQESDELLLAIVKNIREDGFDKSVPDPVTGVENVALKILSASIVKMLALATEKTGRLDLAKAYMEMVPMHVELIKVYTFRALEREGR
jgi:hypothetical protein